MPITIDEFVARLGAVDTPDKVVGILYPAALATATDAQNRAQSRVANDVLRSRSGRLKSSIAGSVKGESGGSFAIVLRAGGRVGGYSVPYAAAHEFGATITPKRAKFLRIPLPAARTAAGVDRYATPLRQTGAGMFHVRRSASGRLLLFNNATGEPWYLLVRQSKVRARPFLRPSLTEAGEKLPGRIQKRLRDAVMAPKGGQ